MEKSQIIIKSEIKALDLCGLVVPTLQYQIFVDGKRFGVPCKSFEELQNTIICSLIIQEPQTEFDIHFSPFTPSVIGLHKQLEQY